MKGYQEDFLAVVREYEKDYDEDVRYVLEHRDGYEEGGEPMIDILHEDLMKKLYNMCSRFAEMGGTRQEAIEVFGEDVVNEAFSPLDPLR